MSYKSETGPENVVTLKVVGVGGAGNNVVNRMVKSGTQGVEFISVNTDKQALAVSSADQKIQIGEKLTHGQGAGSDPDVGKRSAEESRNDIAKSLEDADMVFIPAGMGGGTGTGAAPTVAEIAREAGTLTVGVVTKPFKFEGKRRMDQALAGINSLLGKVDSLLIIPNDRLKYATDQKVTLANAFEIADDVLRQAVTSISDLIKNTGFINLDFADVTTIMKDAGFAHMGVGHAVGKGKAEEAAKMAVASPLMETSINGAHGVLINVTGSEDMGLEDVEAAANLVQEAAHPDANIIFGSSFDESLAGKIRVSIVATGIGENIARQAQSKPLIKPGYLEESYGGETVITPNEELDSNLEKFSATKTEVAEDVNEVIEKAEIISIEQEASAPAEETIQNAVPDDKIEDFDSLDRSSVMSEMPKASSLFKAIINKTEDINAEAQLEGILSSNENSFTAKTSLRTVEEEPELFPNHNPAPFSARKSEEPEQLIVSSEEEEYTPTLIERVTGFSIAKRNRKKLKEHEQKFQEPVSPSFAEDDYREEDKLNLEIPSFLRRK